MGNIVAKMVSAANTTNYLYPALPIQKLPESKKDLDWVAQNIDSIIAMGSMTFYNNRTTRWKKQVNYNIINSIFDDNDFKYVTDPYGLSGTVGNQPEKLHNFNIVRPGVEFLKGEELKRSFNFTVMAVGGDVINDKATLKNNLMNELVHSMVINNMVKDGILSPEQATSPEFKTPEDIERFMSKDYRHKKEQLANKILKYLEYKERFKTKFNRGWEHALIAGEEVYYTGIVSGEPVLRVVDPLYFDYHRSPNMENIEDALWCREDRWLSRAQVLDEYGEFLDEDQLERIDRGMYNTSVSMTNVYPGFQYAQDTLPSNATNYYGRNSYLHPTDVYVGVCCWKSMRKIAFLKYIDDKGEQQMDLLTNEDFKLSKEQKDQGYSLEYQWISDVWKGVRIGRDIYVDYGPLPNQMRKLDNPSICKLPYVGRIYNSINSQSTSFVDLCKPYQYVYLIMWYRMLNEIAKAKGKKMVMDIAMIPKSYGFDLDKWMHYFDNLGIAFINSFEEGREGDPNSVSKFNQFTAIDMTLSNTIAQYMGVLDKIENMMADLTGMSNQRKGEITPSESVTNANTAIAQSATITESMYMLHDEVKVQVLSQLLETAKLAYAKGKQANFVINETEQIMLNVDQDALNDVDFGVFVSNSSKDQFIKDQLVQLAHAAMQNDKVTLHEIVKIFKSNSISEIEDILEDSENRSNQLKQQEIEQQQQHEKDLQEMVNQSAFDERMFKAEQNNLDRMNKLDVAKVSALSYNENKDLNDNKIPDILEFEKLKAEGLKTQSELSIKKEQNNIKLKEIDQKDRLAQMEMDKYKTEQAQQNKHHEDEIKLREKEIKASKKNNNTNK